MSALVLNMIPEPQVFIEEDDWESCEIPVLSVPPISVPAPTLAPIATPKDVSTLPTPTETKLQIKNIYNMYPYFLASVQGTIPKDLFPRADFPLGNLKQSLTTQTGINNYVHAVRNHIKSMFYVLKSTKFYNPVAKTRVPPKKREPVDPNFQHVALKDQLKIYKLFGFQGHIGSKKGDEDSQRDELLEKLKNILYYTNSLIVFIELLFMRIEISVDQSDIRRACEQLKIQSDYEQKSYGLSANWFHDPSWQKLYYVYGKGALDNLCGGDGGIPNELQHLIMKADSYHK